MEPVTWHVVRLTLHVLAATIWVGGQLTLAALLPVLRRIGTDAPRLAARRFAAVAWTAFAVLALTGVWNVAAEWHEMDASYRTTLIVKLCAVVVSGLAAFAHQRARTPAGLAVFGAISGLAALVVVFLGVLLVSGH